MAQGAFTWAHGGLTPRSSGAPTAGHQARSGGTRYIFASPGLASCRCRPLSSNVRRQMATLQTSLAVSIAAACSLVGHAESSYANPADGTANVRPVQFKLYQPVTPRDQSKQRVKTEGVILLTGDSDIQNRITVADLSSFIRMVEQRAFAALENSKVPTQVMVQFSCIPNRCSIKIASDGKASNAVLQSLHDSLNAMPPLRASGEVIFQVKFQIDA
jgi:hypothetical protein